MLLDNRHLVKNTRNIMNIDSPCGGGYTNISLEFTMPMDELQFRY